jgi:Ca2+-binding RTX toxin-like protein
VIEQASGGNGDDVLVGNTANNTLIGNGGKDTFVYFASTTYNNGTDVIKDFQDGLDAIEIVQSQGGLSGLAAGMAANDANKYFAAAQSGSDTKVTLFAGDGQTTVGTVYLSNFQASNLTYTDFKVI